MLLIEAPNRGITVDEKFQIVSEPRTIENGEKTQGKVCKVAVEVFYFH
jgi:hypothetical protein